jgi:hypothetical protein
MPSNTTLNPGAAGDIIATKERTHDGDATKVQVVSLAGVAGTEGSYTFADINGDATNGLDVDVTRLPALPAGTNNIGDVDVLTLPALPAGTNNIGDVDIASIAAGDNNIGNVDVLTVPADPFGANADAASATGSISAKLRFIAATGIPITSIAAGDNNIGNVDVLSLPALAAGANNIGDVDVLTLPALPAGTNNIGDVDVLTLPNVTLAAGTNTNEVVGDVAHDAAAAGNPLLVGGYASAAAPADVSADGDAVRAWRLRNGASATVVTAGGALIGGDATNGLDVDVTRLPALAAGTNNIGDVDVLTLPALPAGNNNIGDVDIATIAAGDNNIGNVDVLSVIPGTAATSLGKAEDAAHTSGDVGVMSLAVRRDADTTLVATDGDYAPLQVNAAGSLKVAITAGAGSGGTSLADGATFTRDTTSITPVGAVVETAAPTLTNGDAAGLSMTTGGALRVSVASGGIAGVLEDAASAGGEEGVMVLAVRRDSASSGVSADGDFAALSVTSDGSLRVSGGGGGTQFAEDVAHTTGDVGTVALAVRRDTAAVGSGTDGDYSTLNVNASGRLYASATIDAALPAGTNNIGDVDVLTLPALAAGTNNIGDVDVLTLPALPAGSNNIGDVDVLSLIPGTGATALGKATDTAAGATDTGVASLLVRDDALTTLTPVDGDYAPARVDSVGAQWVRSSAELADDAAFTPATSRVLPVGLFADETATDSVDEGDIGAARMTLDRKAILTPYAHAAAGGATPYQNLDVDETEDEVKGTAGKIFTIHVMNMAATVRYLKVYNATAATVVVGTTTPVFTFPIPTLANTNGAGFTAHFGDIGAQFSTAITIAATTGLAVADTGAPGANEVVVNLTFL